MNRIELDTEEIELIKSLVMQADPFDTVGIAEKKVNHIEQNIISLEAKIWNTNTNAITATTPKQ